METEARLTREVAALLAEAAARDAAEDQQYGPGTRGDELPAALARRASRLAKIREAKAALEAEAPTQAEQDAAAARAKRAARDRSTGTLGSGRRAGRKWPEGRPPAVPGVETAAPAPTAPRNFTDPESRIMREGATQSFVQAYNAQAAVGRLAPA